MANEKRTRLADAPAGLDGVVAEVAGGRGASGRLVSLGIYAGRRVRVVHNDGFGPVIVAVAGSRVALGRGIAGKVVLSCPES